VKKENGDAVYFEKYMHSNVLFIPSKKIFSFFPVHISVSVLLPDTYLFLLLSFITY